MPDQQLIDDIDATRDYIDVHGWAQDNLEDDKGGVCLMGGVRRAIRPGYKVRICHDPRISAAEGFLTEMIEQTLGDSVNIVRNFGVPFVRIVSRADYPVFHHLIPYYNDYVIRSKAEALAFLDKAKIVAQERA